MSTGNRIVDLKLFHQYVLYMVFSFFFLFSCVTYPFKVSVVSYFTSGQVRCVACLYVVDNASMTISSFITQCLWPCRIHLNNCNVVWTTSWDALLTSVCCCCWTWKLCVVYMFCFWGGRVETYAEPMFECVEYVVVVVVVFKPSQWFAGPNSPLGGWLFGW